MRGHWLCWGVFLLLAPAQVVSGFGCGLEGPDPPEHAGALPNPQPEPVELRMGTYNVHDLFNDRVDGSSAGVQEARNTPSTEEYERRLAQLAGVLDELAADVMALQEVENRDALERLATQGPLRGIYPYRVLVEGNDPRGIDVAVLSRYPVVHQQTHRNDWFFRRDESGGDCYRYARDCLEVHLKVAGRRVILLVVHFKSHRDDDPDRRLAEAQQTRLLADRLAEEHSQASLVIAGDFNDPPESSTLSALTEAPGCVLCDGTAYASVGAWLLPAERWTTVDPTTGHGVLFDDLLVSPLLYDGLDTESVRALHESVVSGPFGPVSDHAPLVATFRLDAVEIEP